MIWQPILGFAVVAAVAIAFVASPLWRAATGKARFLLLASVAVFVLGVGGGVYWMVGRPHLAARDAKGLTNDERDVRALIPPLIKRVRQYPNDDKAWRYLASAYMSASDPADAAKALAKVIALVGKTDPVLDAAYGESLVLANDGAVPDEAENSFKTALQVDPHSAPARFYLGLARAQHHDNAAALQYWQSLLADIPADSSLHQVLVNKMAMLTSQSGGMPAGGPMAMVAKLAAQLKADPNNGLGWLQLVRAYHVLGEDDKARAALNQARTAFKGNKDMLAAFDTAEKDLH